MKLVLVKWIDAHSYDQWTELEELRDASKPTEITSVGWLISENEHFKMIAPHISSSHNASGTMGIPNTAIVKIVELKEPK